MNLLYDKVLPLLDNGAQQFYADLPSLLTMYGRDEILDLSFLRPHQRSPWHSFMVQLGAIALHRGGHDNPVQGSETWRTLLRALTSEWPDDEPWRLIVKDPAKPAFMQPPVTKGMADPHKTPIMTPGDLDILVTAKNHGLKQGLASNSNPVAWFTALIMLQTTGGFLGAGNYGIARMNGGFATRPFIGLVPDGGVCAHWRRDVEVMLKSRKWFFERVEDFARTDGAVLLWCLPWNGERSMDFAQLDPWFIEVCRRVRLYEDVSGQITAKSVGSKATRIAAKGHLGNVGDPWIPINIEKNSAAYNTKPTYRVMSAVLFDHNHWRRPLLLDWHEGLDQVPMTARFEVTLRGQGVTEGQHLREVPIDTLQRRNLFQTDVGRDRLAELSSQLIKDIGTLENKVLKIPLLTLIQAGDEKVNLRDCTANDWIRRWFDRVEDAIDPVFFDQLFKIAETESYRDWGFFLRTTTYTVFEAATRAVPLASVRRLKAIAVAEQKLSALFWSSFKGYIEQSEQETVDAN